MMARYVQVLADRGEYDILTVDVSYKVAAKQVAGAKSAKSGVLTVCGASRTLLGAVLCEAEAPDTIKEKLEEVVPAHVRERVRFVVLDKVDAHGYVALLREVFPRLLGVAQDPIHLCMRFDRGDFAMKRNLRSAGVAMRAIMGRFCRKAPEAPPSLCTIPPRRRAPTPQRSLHGWSVCVRRR